jgi:general secretion pathway protein L
MTTLRFDLKTQITWTGLAASGRRFLAWWRESLWELLSQPWRRRVSAALNNWTVHLDGETLRLSSASATHEDLVLDSSVAEDEMRERIARLAPACLERRIDAVIPSESGLTRRLTLPAAAAPRLRSVVELQLGRLSPFRAEDVRFDCRRVGGESGGEIDVEVAIVPKQALEAIEQRLERLGISVRRFRFADPPFSFAAVVSRHTYHERLQYILGAVASATFIAAVMLAPVLRASELDGLAAEVGSLRGPAHQAASLRDELRRAQGPLDAAAMVLGRPGPLDVLQRLTVLLPKDAQLTDLKIDRTAVRLSGYSGNAGKLAALLRKSGEFSDVRLSGPVGKAADGRERFEIEMSLPARKPPAKDGQP